MKNIHVLPTDKPSKLYLGDNGNFVFGLIQSSIKSKNNDFTNQNIYITSDEDIKEGDWCIADYVTGFTDLKGNPCNDGSYHVVKTNNIVLGNVEHGQQLLFSFNNLTHELRYCKKIILTTDQDLIKDGVQAIDDEFLEWFVKNSSCEEVKTIYGLFNPMGRQVDPKNLVQNQSKCVWKYKIIIPKEEPIQEPCCTPIGQIKRYVDCKGCDRKPVPMTLEEAAEAYVNKEGDIPTTELEDAIFKQGFIDGAKWQVKSMYSEEDIISLIQFLSQDEDFDSYTSVSKETAKYYLERFKVERL